MEIIANASQAITTNSNVLFTDIVVPGNCSILHRKDSGLILLRGITAGQCRARYKVTFNSNLKADTSATVSSATPVSLGIALDGEVLSGTTMTITVADTTSVYNIGASVLVDIPRFCDQTISIKNTSAITVDTINANLIVERVA